MIYLTAFQFKANSLGVHKNHGIKNQKIGKNKKVVYLATFFDNFLARLNNIEILSLAPLKIKKKALLLVPFVAIFGLVISYAMEGPRAYEEIVSKREFNFNDVSIYLSEDGSHIDYISNGPSVKVPSDQVRGIYVTMWTASRKEKMDELIKLIDETDINSVVIDVKGSQGELIHNIWPGIKDLIKELHQKNIYTIARIVVFQDSGYATEHPEFALKKQDGNLWRDRRGFAWLDPASKGSWGHIVDVAKKAIDLGFDEIQYDYIRFPTDGNLSAIIYPAWDGQKPRHEALKEFFAYSKEELKKYYSKINLSMDIFGYTFIQSDDLGIGQILSEAINYFDYISPMVYPSHYGAGNFGFDNPADYPYEVVFGTLKKGFDALGASQNEALKHKIRPWLQVFDMGARYDSTKIKAQIKAVHDNGSQGWLMWDPNNRYGDVMEALKDDGKIGEGSTN